MFDECHAVPAHQPLGVGDPCNSAGTTGLSSAARAGKNWPSSSRHVTRQCKEKCPGSQSEDGVHGLCRRRRGDGAEVGGLAWARPGPSAVRRQHSDGRPQPDTGLTGGSRLRACADWLRVIAPTQGWTTSTQERDLGLDRQQMILAVTEVPRPGPCADVIDRLYDRLVGGCDISPGVGVHQVASAAFAAFSTSGELLRSQFCSLSLLKLNQSSPETLVRAKYANRSVIHCALSPRLSPEPVS